MPNEYFRFRQFTVWQEGCAMKVCTDACLFGAWTAQHTNQPTQILDIGTGTGLLSLMLAQQTNASLDAVELDEGAAFRAAENFRKSPWSERLQVIQSSIQEFALGCGRPSYDLIVSNPPFFENDLKSSDSKRNLALHNAGLSLEELLDCACRLLHPDGYFAVMVPSQRAASFELLAGKKGLYALIKTSVRQTAQHTFFRMLYLFCRVPVTATGYTEITIKDDNHTYTPEFSMIMKDYYLVPDNALR